MIKFKHILFPTDFSECADRALKHAVALAKEHRAKLTLLHVVIPYMEEVKDPEQRFPGDRKLGDILQELEADARLGLDQCVTGPLEKSSLDVERVFLRAFSPSEKIIDFADKEDVDMIVMGSHGRRGFRRVLLGSEAERVLRLAPCPVLTLSTRTKSADPIHGYKKILVPFDFSDHSSEALRYGLAIGTRYGATVDLVHVFDQPISPPCMTFPATYYAPADPSLKRKCVEAMGRELVNYPASSAAVEIHAVEGRVSSTLRAFAKEHGSDLIVIGTRGLAGVDYVLLGSTASRMLRMAPCPILTVHARSNEEIEVGGGEEEASC